MTLIFGGDEPPSTTLEVPALTKRKRRALAMKIVTNICTIIEHYSHTGSDRFIVAVSEMTYPRNASPESDGRRRFCYIAVIDGDDEWSVEQLGPSFSARLLPKEFLEKITDDYQLSELARLTTRELERLTNTKESEQ